MSILNNLTVLTFSYSLLVVPVLNQEANAKTKYRLHHRHLVSHHHHPRYVKPAYDSSGWRHRTRGWDNTCINLPYLASEFACDAK
jgi:hypothetical protein